MPTFLFKGVKEKGGIPRRSKVRVESLPKRYCVFSGTVSGSVALELDPGKYAFKVGCFPEGKPGMKYTGVFLWGVTEEQYQLLANLRPRNMRIVNTSDGVRYYCQYSGCDLEFTSATGAILHETGEHQGKPIIEIDEDAFDKPRLTLAEELRASKKIQRARTEIKAREADKELVERVQAELDQAAAIDAGEKKRHAEKVNERQVV